MKKLCYVITFALLVGLVLWALSHKKPEPSMPPTPVEPHNPQPSGQAQQPPKPTSSAVRVPPPGAPRAPGRSDTGHIVEGVLITPEVARYVQSVLADPQFDWKQPINFFGRVVDENNQPVEGASVDFKWTDLSTNGTSEYHTTSDSVGLFSMVDQRGKRLSVSASKPGYYSAADARLASFEYANPADGLFTPDPNNPVVLHLRKKGAGVDLTTSQYGMSPDFPISIPRDGTLVNLDVMQRKVGGTGQIQISESKPERGAWQQATAWWFRMQVPDGGFVEQKDEFPFEAPESGYQPIVQFDFQQGQTNWTTGFKKDFYIKFGNPPRYGRFQVQTDISYGGAIITYAINPTGSRNLEPK